MPPKIARLDYQGSAGTAYLLFLEELARKDLIVRSQDRDLTDSGRRVVGDAFGGTIDIGRVVTVIKTLRQGNPDLSEMDAFVHEASDLVYILSTDAQRRDIDVRECRMLMPRKGTYILGGIHTLREATRTGRIMVNPLSSPNDQCHVRYL